MKIRYLMASVALISASSALADQAKVFECEVSTYVGGKAGYGTGWINPRISVPPVSIQAKSFQGHDEGETSKVISVGQDYEIVFDLHWQSGSLANDDITNIDGAKMRLTSRLQRTAADGSTIVLDIGEEYSNVKDDASAGRLWIDTRLYDLQIYSTALNRSINKTLSHSALQEVTGKVPATSIYNLNCSTTVGK